MRPFLALVILLLLSLGTGKTLYDLKGGFSHRRVQTLITDLPLEWSEEASAALKQPFYYLGRGRQCFAFASRDGKYVLKLPRTDIFKVPFWVHSLGLKSYKTELKKRQTERQDFLLESFKLAFSELQNQTGILALHMRKTKLSSQLILFDKFGCKYSLPLDKTSFVLQYKQPLLTQEYLSARQQSQTDTAKKILNALLKTIRERAQKGILNRDRSFLRNYGFDGENAYQIDVGSFFRKETLPQAIACEKSLRDSTDPIREWLAKIDPEMLPYFNDQLEKIFVLLSKDQREM